MKKISLALSFVLVALASSCSKDDCPVCPNQGAPAELDEIIGEWKPSEYNESSTFIQIFKKDTTFNGSFVAKGVKFNDAKLFFVENPKKVISEGTIDSKVTYTMDGNTEDEVDELDRPFNHVSGDWEKVGDMKYKVTSPGKSVDVTITELTDSKLAYEAFTRTEKKTDTTYSLLTYTYKAVFNK